jgi:hypothetical protein
MTIGDDVGAACSAVPDAIHWPDRREATVKARARIGAALRHDPPGCPDAFVNRPSVNR